MSWFSYPDLPGTFIAQMKSKFAAWWWAEEQPDLSRRRFLLGATAAAALVTTSLPSFGSVHPEFDVAQATSWLIEARWSILEEVQKRCLEEIMAAEDARVFALLDSIAAAGDAEKPLPVRPDGRG